MWLKPCSSQTPAAQALQQHKAAMGKATPGKVQPQSRKRGTAGAKKKPGSSKAQKNKLRAWKACENLLRKSMEEIRKGSFQLIHVLACSELLHGVEAEVNWYTGGNSYVTLPTAVAEERPGVYLAKAKFIRFKDIPEDDSELKAAKEFIQEEDETDEDDILEEEEEEEYDDDDEEAIEEAD